VQNEKLTADCEFAFTDDEVEGKFALNVCYT